MIGRMGNGKMEKDDGRETKQKAWKKWVEERVERNENKKRK